ncbi:MAG: RICIN domain-containing protein, partial [Methylococcaceae bacterium]
MTGASQGPVGSAVCRSGATSGWHCGGIVSRNATIATSTGHTFYNQISSSVCASPGDSGGSLLWGNNAQGVTSTTTYVCGGAGGTSSYQPIVPIMNAWRLTLYTIPGGTVPPRETDPPPPAGSFRLKAGHSGQCVEVNGHSTAAAAQLVQNTCSNSLSQYWLSVANADGFMLKNAKSNLCLGVNGGSLANGTNVIQWPCDRGANSTLYRSGNTVVFKHSRQCLSVYGALPAAGTGLVQSICTGGSHQAITGGGVAPLPSTPPPAGSFRLKVGHSGQCVEVNGQSTAAAAQLVQNTCSNNLSQYWVSVTNADGFMLKNTKSNLCLGVTGGSQAVGTNVLQ